ncbi:hypothetical protein ACHAQA_000332 [Verticillium albo-atrum]
MAPRTVLITGCSAGGIGAALAFSLAQSDHHIFATARVPSKIPEDLSQHPNVTVLALDVTSAPSLADAVQAVAESGRQLDVLVNNAGGGYAMPVLDIDIDQAKALYETNVWGPIRVIQGFSAQLIASRGRVVNLNTCGIAISVPWISTYISSKAALAMYSETLRMELAPFGVDVLTIMVGTVKSRFHVNDPFALPAGSLYAPIEEIIAGWANGVSTPKGISTEEFASMVARDVVESSTGVIWKGPNAGTMRTLAKWAPQSVLDAGMRQGQGFHELTQAIKQGEKGQE